MSAWKAKNKTDLVIEVWENLDCESVGAAEIIAIEGIVKEKFGPAAVDSPMVTARTLADEGAVLRHSEIMGLYVKRASRRPYEAELRNLPDLTSLTTALRSIREAENLRRKFETENDREGLRHLREKVKAAKEKIAAKSGGKDSVSVEIAQWLTLWLQSPELFETWIAVRRRSEDYISHFGPTEK